MRLEEHDDGVFNDRQLSDQEFDDEIVSIDSQTSMMDQNVSNDLIDSQLNPKDKYVFLKKREVLVSQSSKLKAQRNREK